MSEFMNSNIDWNIDSPELLELRQELSEINDKFDVERTEWGFNLVFDWAKLDVPLRPENILSVARLTNWVSNYYEENHSWTWNQFFVKLSEMWWKYYDIHINDNPSWILENIQSLLRWWDTKVVRQEILMWKAWVTSQELYVKTLDLYWSQHWFMEMYSLFLNEWIEISEATRSIKEELDTLYNENAR